MGQGRFSLFFLVRIIIEGISWLCVFVSYRDFTWDVNDYLLGLRDDVKSWKEVYWR